MGKMSYKEFVWPSNPEVLKVSHKSVPHHVKDEGGTYVFSGMGGDQCLISGSGEFTGPSIDEYAAALDTVFKDITGGILQLPSGTKLQAFLTELSYTRDARQMYLAYDFTFRATDRHGAIPK